MNRQILDEASAWFVELRTGELQPAASAQFDAWLRRSPEHIRAYIEIARTYVGLAAVNANHGLDVQKLIAVVRSSDNVVSIGQPNTFAERNTKPRRRATAIAAAASIVLGIAAASLLVSRHSQSYETDIGERRSITLADGSIIDLNAHSKIRVRFSSSERAIELSDGQALFEVAKDSARPFIVHSGSAMVRAVGTQFSVYKKKSGTTVTVVEGRVAVQTDMAPAAGAAANPGVPVVAGTLVSAGQQVVVTEALVAPPVKADIASATAWIQQRLIFDGSRLSDVVEDFNRYNTRQLIIDDRALDDFHISGAYSSTDPASLLRFLRDQPGIQVLEADDSVRITRK